jgi:hypothetical protein
MSKFLLNLLVQISKDFVYSKIQILFGNHFSSDSDPTGPAPSSHGSFARRPPCTLGPLGLSSLGVFAKRCLFFKFAQSVNGISSHVAAKWAPPVRSTPSSCRPTRSTSPPRLAAIDRPCLSASMIETPIKAPYSPALIPPLESPLTPPGHQWRRP